MSGILQSFNCDNVQIFSLINQDNFLRANEFSAIVASLISVLCFTKHSYYITVPEVRMAYIAP